MLTEIAITIQYLYLNGAHTNLSFCDQRLEFTTSAESKKTYCNPRLEIGALQKESFIVPEGGHLNITLSKCSNTKGGKFWIQFTGNKLLLSITVPRFQAYNNE